MFSRFSLYSVLSLFAYSLALAETPKLPDNLEGSLDTNPETASALFMLSLYDQKLAGGDTGVCLDFSSEDGKSQIRVGMDTSAFVLGKSGS